jgi:hypothetical protein
LVKAVATAAYESDTPLLPEQAAALTASIERHSTVRASIPGLVDYALDGKAIAADAAGMLSGPQMELFNAAAWRYLPSSGGPRPYHP